MSEFFFALTNPEAEALLKEEVGLRYPELKLSYNRPGFLTFKGERKIDFYPAFARVAGNSLGKFKLSDLAYERAWVWKRPGEFQIPPRLQELSDRTIFKIGEKVTLVMMAGADDFWVGEYMQRPSHFQTPGEVSSILETEAPSRAYYKIAEAVESFDLPFENQEVVLELGSAPGGASQFLLEQDLKIIGVDPADMAPEILKNFNFKHLRRPFETLNAESFTQDVDWIISDINLPPTVVVKEVLRLLEFLKPRGLVLTLKINQGKHLRMLDSVVREFKAKGFTKVQLKYLPSHRQEICLVALTN